MSDGFAPPPEILGQPESATCDFCGDPADHLVRIFPAHDAPSEPGDSPCWNLDLCETCYLLQKKCDAMPDGGMEFLKNWPGRRADEGDE
jgi:hypothetical protein